MRPKRVYKTKNGKYYYLVKGKKKYVKNKKEGITVNIKKIVVYRKKPLKRRKKTVFAVNPKELPRTGLSSEIPIKQKIIPSIEDASQTDIKKRARIEEELKNKNQDKDDFKKLEKKIKLLEDKKYEEEKDEEEEEEEEEEEYVLKKSSKIEELKETRANKNIINSINSKFEEFKDKKKLEHNVDSWNLFKQDPSYEKKVRKNSLKNISGTPRPIIYYKYSPFETKGKGEKGNDGLFNTDIEDIMKGLKFGPVPVIPSDKINMLLDYVKPNMEKFGAIINTNPSTSDGSGTDGHRVGHWRAIFFDNDDDFVSSEYFDPLVEGKIPNELKTVMTKIAKKMNPEDYSLFKENHLKRQSDSTDTCGYHSIKFIDDRMNNVPWSKATGYDDFMAKNKPDDSIDGEMDLIKPINKYNKFI